MEVQAYIKYVHISPKKLRFIITDIKKKTPRQALDHLFTSQKRSSKVLYKAVKSAVDNARQVFKTDDSALRFKTFLVEEGPSLKRMRPGSKGMANMYQRRTSHIKVVLIKEETKPATAPKTETKGQIVKKEPLKVVTVKKKPRKSIKTT